MTIGSTSGRQPDAASRKRRKMPRLRDAQIRTKLALILSVPILAVVVLAGLRLVDVGRQAYDVNAVRELTRLSVDVSELAHQLHRERMIAGAYLVKSDAPAEPYTAQVARTDQQITAYSTKRAALDDVPTAVGARLQRIDDDLKTLNGTRAIVQQRGLVVGDVNLRYRAVIEDLVAYGAVLGQFADAGRIADQVRAVSAFAKAKAGTAEEEAVAFAALSTGRLTAEQYTEFLATQAAQQAAFDTFAVSAAPAQQTLVNNTVTGDAVGLADNARVALRQSVDQPARMSAADAAAAIGAVTDLMRWAERQLENRLLEDATTVSDEVSSQALYEAIAVVAVLLLAVLLAVVLARSLLRSLRRLREGALTVAHRDLPDAVARLRDVRNLGEGAAEDIVRQVRDPIPVVNRDEVGQVAQAFNVVHKEAVRIAAEQAALRTSVSAMFLNLARRSQSLVDRMIGELDQIERGEEDPKRLAQLFELDHLATRMRRNDENLLVLAGADSSSPRREDALLIDALRAAQSEVELYNRIEFGTVDADVLITAPAVNDTVRLVAELLDNATRFSPPNTIVVADARRVRDYVVIQIEDRGLGMSEEQMTSLNQRLAQPPDVDVAAFRLMGLAVVGRLASRFGIRVELRANLEGGSVAQVTLPAGIVVLPERTPVAVGGRSMPAVAERPSGGFARGGTATLAAIGGRPWGDTDELPAAGGPADRDPLRPYGGARALPAPEPASGEPSWPTTGIRGGDHTALAGPTVGAPIPAPAPTDGSAGSPTLAIPTLPEAPQGRSTGSLPQRTGGRGREAAWDSPDPDHPAEQPGDRPTAVPESRAAVWPSRTDSASGTDEPDTPLPGTPHQPRDGRGDTSGRPADSSDAGTEQRNAAADRPVDSPTASPDVRAVPVEPVSPPPQVAYLDSAGGDAGTGFAPDAAVTPSETRPVDARTAGWGAALAGLPPPPPPPTVVVVERTEAPIYRQMEAHWFRDPGPDSEEWSMPTAGYAPPPSPSVTPPGAGAPAPALPQAPSTGSVAATGAGPDATTTVDGGTASGSPKGSAAGADAGRPALPIRRPGASTVAAAPTGSGFDLGDRQPRPSQPPTPAGFDATSAGTMGADTTGSDTPGSDTAGGVSSTWDSKTRESPATSPKPPAPAPAADAGQPAVPRQRQSPEQSSGWRTSADEGWNRAMAAADPATAGTTRSGLPKRVPQAQLVPGGVQPANRERNRRSPDEVRGLLSAYHRGVQRGRSAGSAESDDDTGSGSKENEQ